MFNQPININQKSFLLLLYIVALGVFTVAVYSISHNNSLNPLVKQVEKETLQTRISVGDKILVTAHNNSAKQAGIDAYIKEDYDNAIQSFSSSLKSDRNDPEARIYLNNAIAAKTKAPYLIGVSVPIGGDLAVAEEILRGVAQAQEKINSNGGIKGKLLMIKIANDDNNPQIAQEIAQEFVQDQKVLAVVGHNSSDTSIAAAPIYQKAGLVMITPTSSAESLSTMGDYIFRTAPSTRALTDSLADYAVNTAGKTSIGICIDSGAEASVSFKDNFTWAVYNYGGKINPVNCDLSAADFNGANIPSQAISLGADALLLAPSVQKVDQAMEIVTANEDRLILLGNHSLNTYTTLKQGQKAVNGMVLAVPWYPQLKNNFTQDAIGLWGGGVNWRTAMTYDATQTLSEAMAAGAERKTLQQALANPEFTAQGATTKISFLPSGDRNLKGTLVKIQPGSKSGTGYDFMALNEEHIPAIATPNPEVATTRANQ
jgi:branched-chain amino acid transport system substrate-binding protein